MFARVRPAKDSEAAEATPGKPVVGYPAAGDLLGRGLELRQPAAGGGPKGGSSSDVQAHTFGFDRVFAPTASQVGLAGVLAAVLARVGGCCVSEPLPCCLQLTTTAAFGSSACSLL